MVGLQTEWQGDSQAPIIGSEQPQVYVVPGHEVRCRDKQRTAYGSPWPRVGPSRNTRPREEERQ